MSLWNSTDFTQQSISLITVSSRLMSLLWRVLVWGQCLIMGAIISPVRPLFTVVISSQPLIWMCMRTYMQQGTSRSEYTSRYWKRCGWVANRKASRRLQASGDGKDSSWRLDPTYRLPGGLYFLFSPSPGTFWASVLLLQWFSMWLPGKVPFPLQLSLTGHWETVFQSIYALLAHSIHNGITYCHANKKDLSLTV